ncbi:hypothetical protein BC940DRAFT_298712 [Gongronella butleri]|nr:hypothetical protein BC940DRAFT_298712 [Gongronella butleri]
MAATRDFAGVTLVDTPLTKLAMEYARTHYDAISFNHAYRVWVLGALIATKLPEEFQHVDLEVHAIAALFHDLAWDYKSPFSTPDKRFEVDSANAARAWLEREAPDWDARKRQLVWDGIALHATGSIARYKEPEVALCQMGVRADFVGYHFPGGIITEDEFATLSQALPRTGFKQGFKELMCNLCIHKPETTYDNYVKDFGDRFVEGYKAPSSVERTMYTLDD